jgi:ribosomal-protein-alanine N-acetyltransferase
MRLSSLSPALLRGFRVESGRIYLRPLRQNDWGAWAALREASRDFLVPWEPTWAHDALGRSAFRRRVRAYDREWQQGTGYSLMLIRRGDEALLGGITGFCFDELGLHRVEAACLPSNAASKALLIRARFKEEGYARGYLRINGRWQDHLLFAILREDRALAKGPRDR